MLEQNLAPQRHRMVKEAPMCARTASLQDPDPHPSLSSFREPLVGLLLPQVSRFPPRAPAADEVHQGLLVNFDRRVDRANEEEGPGGAKAISKCTTA